MWTLERLESLSKEQRVAIVSSSDRAARVHALKFAAERLAYQPEDQKAAEGKLSDSDGFVARAAAEALAHHEVSSFEHLLKVWDAAPPEDVLRDHAIRMAVRYNFDEALRDGQSFLALIELGEERWRQLARIASVIHDKRAANFLAVYLQRYAESDAAVAEYSAHVARNAEVLALDRDFVEWAKDRAGSNVELSTKLVQALADAPAGDLRAKARPWALEVANALLETSKGDQIGWTAVPVEGKPASESPWVIAARPCADGVYDQAFYYSLPKGEQRTGIYRSGTFEIPAKLSFWCCGHSGFPGKALNDGNYIRLRDATTHAILAESRPPRNDTAQRFEWDLKAATSGRGYLELIDGDTAGAYAWLAVGRFSLAALNPSDTAKKQQLAAEIIGKLKLKDLRPHLATLVASPNTDGAARSAAGQALVALDPDARAAALVLALNEPSIYVGKRARIGYAIIEDADMEYIENLREVMKLAPARLQSAIAEALTGDPAGASALLVLVESGHASPRLLLAPNVSAKLAALKSESLDARVATATAKLPPVSETLDKLLLERRVSFANATPNLEKGLAVFTKHCAGCHQIEGKGSVVGPQLDGIGGRGLERIIEDILDPNRNVDVAFRTTTIRTADGQILSGLFRREEGAQLVFADKEGKEFTLAKDDIDQQQKTNLSLMPANVPEIVPAEEFHDLIAWLLSKRAAASTPQ
jgi:putative heme-binding domain-containing protein